MLKYFTVGLLIGGFLFFAFSLGCGQSDTPTTTTSSSTTTTTIANCIIRLYYTYPTDPTKKSKTYDSQNFGSAYSTDGVNFTQEAGARFGPLANLTDPDVLKEAAGKWVLFYSKAVSSDPSEASELFKATATTPNGTFTADSTFAGGTLGNISSSLKVGTKYYVYLAKNGIKIANYDPTMNTLTTLGSAIANAVDPSVIQLSSNSFKMYYKLSGAVYSADSTDGLVWTNSQKLVDGAEVPGAVFVNNKIYLYYTDNSGGTLQGKTAVRISTDNGATFGATQEAKGLGDAACDPDPLVYE